MLHTLRRMLFIMAIVTGLALGILLARPVVAAGNCPTDPLAEAAPGVDWHGCDLSYADLGFVNLSGANLSLTSLIGADLSGADLSDANLSGADLLFADLSGADLSYADLGFVNLSGANLPGADLLFADLSGADLSDANLSGADLWFADLSGADLSDANLAGANLSSAEGFPISTAGVVWFYTVCPDGSLSTGPPGCYPQTPDYLDYGDAPDSYGTFLASNGSSHLPAPGLIHLGPNVDGEPDGQPSPQADGDDLNPLAPDDEDGVILPPLLTPGATDTIVVDGGPSGGMLDAWIDFNGNGVFDHPAEHLFGGGGILVVPGSNPLNFPVPPSAVSGLTYARFRLSQNGGLLPTGFGGEGEVEDYRVEIEPPSPEPLDYGDAPDSYGTLLASNGASHFVTLRLSLGHKVDAEPDGQPSPQADGDDLNPLVGPDDEDGVTLPPLLIPGATDTIVVNRGLSDAWLDAWIDFNGNGIFDHRVEHLFGGSSIPLGPGPQPLTFSVPPTAVPGLTYARFRLSRNGGLLPIGPGPEGEVEDYSVEIDGLSPLLFVDDATHHMRGETSFQVPVELNPSGHQLSSVGFTLDYDDSCLTFDAVTDSDNDGIPDAVTVPAAVDSFFDVTFELGDDGSGGDVVTLLVKPPEVDPLPVLGNGELARFEFELQASCGTVDFTFPAGTASFGDDNGQAVTGTTGDGTYTLILNRAPTDILLNPTSVDENKGGGSEVGQFTTVDPDLNLTPPVGEGHTYSLVPDCGVNESAGNYAFTIDGDKLKTGGGFDYEVDSFFDICVRTTDAWGLHLDKTFTIQVIDVNETPIDIQLDNNHVAENEGAGTDVGMLSTVDEDDNDSHAYNWCSTPPSEFQLVPVVGQDTAKLQITVALDYETQSTYNICVSSTDAGNLTVERNFTIVVDDVNEAPEAMDDPGRGQPPLIVRGGETVTIDVLANDIAEDGNTIKVHSVTQGINGGAVVAVDSDTKVNYAAPTAYSGPDSFTYQAIDDGAPPKTSNDATVSLNVVADDGRGDCNADGQVDAADFPAEVLEIFDTDESISWWKTYTGEFAGSPRGCDSNASENGLDGLQPSVDAADIICTVLIFFGDDTCRQGGLLAARAANDASLAVADLNAAAGETLAVPLVLDSGGANAAALTFAFEYDAALLNFDAVDDDGDGVPDALALNVPAGMASTVMVEDGRIEVALFGTALPFPLLADGTIATVTLQVNANAGDASTTLGLDNVSLGDDQAQSVTIDAVSGRLTIGEGAALDKSTFLPVITSK